ncbi:MAG: GHMP kinase, partial [Myxococcota bacterium]|nr:GHMP kinase [Myxococcota bacterium]
MQPVVSIAHARVGLLGNPSDGYGGKAIALAIENFRALVTIEASDRFELKPGPSDGTSFSSARDAAGSFASWGPDDGLRLMRAALKRFAGESKAFAALGEDDPLLRFSLGYETDVPRQVGLAGSSAIVVASLRALCDWFGSRIEPARLAELALSAEVEDLGIAAGAMDRVIQAHGGLMAMDLKEPRRADSYQVLDPTRLPPLFVAWDPALGKPSGRAHG